MNIVSGEGLWRFSSGTIFKKAQKEKIMTSQEFLDEMKKECPSAIVSKDIVFILSNQTQRSRANIYKAINTLAKKFPNKKIEFFSGDYTHCAVEPRMDKNSINIIFLAAPIIGGIGMHQPGTTPDNVDDDGKITVGKSVIKINGGWLSLTKNQRQTFVEVKLKTDSQRMMLEAQKLNRIFSENGVELGFAIHNQVYIFSNIFDSTANAGEILSYIIDKASLSYVFSEGLRPDQIAEYIYDLKTLSYRQEIERLQQEIKKLLNDQNVYLEHYIQQVRAEDSAQQRLIGLQNGQGSKENTLTRISNDIQALIDEKKYLEFYIERDEKGRPIFCAVTNKIFIVHKDLVYDFRYFTVKILIDSTITPQSIWFDNPEISFNGISHPHSHSSSVKKRGDICWGNSKAEIAKMCGQGNITEILKYCSFFLNSYSDRQPFFKVEDFGIQGIPLKEFKNRKNPDYNEYKAHKEADNIPVVERVDIHDNVLVCEVCQQVEELCNCDVEHPLVRRNNA